MFSDLHTHSAISDDAEDSMRAMALAAAEKGLELLCLTDHADLDALDGSPQRQPFPLGEWRAAFEEAREAAGDRVALRLGLELGEADHHPEAAAALAAAVPDFIIGSTHNLLHTPDFYCGRPGGEAPALFNTAEKRRALLDRYVSELEATARLGFFDVLGHIGYPLRYMRPYEPQLSLMPWRDRLAELLRGLIAAGKGIEVNTSGLRGSLGETMPAPWLLRLYRDLGGEVLTLGSDAHRCRDLGAGITETKKWLAELGFRRHCVYNKRKAEFYPLLD